MNANPVNTGNNKTIATTGELLAYSLALETEAVDRRVGEPSADVLWDVEGVAHVSEVGMQDVAAEFAGRPFAVRLGFVRVVE